MRETIDGVILDLHQGNIVAEPAYDAIVHDVTADLHRRGGLSATIYDAGGPGLEAACQHHSPLEPGEAVITEGFGLPNPYVIHCHAPFYSPDERVDAVLSSCYRNALMLADKKELTSIMFPAMATDTFEYPIEEAATIAIKTVFETIPELEHITKIGFVLFGDTAYNTFTATIERMKHDQ